MMEASLLILGGIQLVALLLYRWVGKVFVSQPAYNHPGIFHDATARLLLCYGPLVVMAVLVILAFFVTNSPWLFLGLTIAGFIACSVKPSDIRI
jgi:hypothetical protein